MEEEWKTLRRICQRLEPLARKQLRGVPFDKEENDFLIRFEHDLADVMFSRGDLRTQPPDNAPRIVDVFHNPIQKKYLTVGVARPRALYVLYPYRGEEILCRGAVLPYYEFPQPERLTDADWMKRLDSKDRPDIPAWIKPIVGSDGITMPKLRKDH